MNCDSDSERGAARHDLIRHDCVRHDSVPTTSRPGCIRRDWLKQSQRIVHIYLTMVLICAIINAWATTAHKTKKSKELNSFDHGRNNERRMDTCGLPTHSPSNRNIDAMGEDTKSQQTEKSSSV